MLSISKSSIETSHQLYLVVAQVTLLTNPILNVSRRAIQEESIKCIQTDSGTVILFHYYREIRCYLDDLLIGESIVVVIL